MKRVFKIALLSLLAVLMLPVLGLLSVWGMYRHVVGVEPGQLAVAIAPGELGARVDPFIGTGGVPYLCAYNSPAAQMPFGMVRLGPDTASLLTNTTGLNAAGYYYGDNKVIGFSHTRLVGADTLDGGNFRVFPVTGKRVAKAREGKRFARFSHRDETAFPGYYALRLPQENVLVELTATPRVGVHRYTFPKGTKPHLLVDVTSGLGEHRCKDGWLEILPARQAFEGSARRYKSFSGRYGGIDVYFAAHLSRPFASFGVSRDSAFAEGRDTAVGEDILADLVFAAGEEATVVELRLALSFVSIENAWENLEAEAAGRPFDELAREAGAAWEERFSRIRVSGGTERQERIFYTALYHAFTMPSVFSDINGEYLGFDGAEHEAKGFQYYTDFSLWDTFRTVHPLFNLIARDEQRDMMVSLVEMAKAGGGLPRWPAGAGYTNCMFGTPADMAIAEAYLKGIRGFDVETAYAKMRETATTGPPKASRFRGRTGLPSYLARGYCPGEEVSKSVARTLEFAWADYAISLLAKELGHAKDAAAFAKRARSYRNVWNPATQYFQARDLGGDFSFPFDPLQLSYTDFKEEYTGAYVEGSALQWRWAVPFDAEGLVSLFRSPAHFAEELDAFFANNDAAMGAWHPGSYYWHGNEPDLCAAYLFNAAGRPDLTQKWVRWILETRYDDNYVGLDGNDDGGTLSAWYVFNALGFYPIAGTTRYELGAPLFAEAQVRMDDGLLTIRALNHGPQNVYVRRVTWNGAPLEGTTIDHALIAKGGILCFEMAPTARGS